MSIPSRHAPLPEGEEKARAVRAMFDAIAPRYDLVNRVMTFRMDVGWRRAHGRRARAAQRLDRAGPRVGHGRPLPRAARPRPRGDQRRPVRGDAARRSERRAPRARRRAAAPPPRRRRRRRDVRVRAAQPARACGRSSPSSLASCGSAGESRCSRSRPLTTRSCVGVTASTSATSSRSSAGWLSDGDAYRYLPRSVAYLPEPDRRSSTMFRAAGFPDAQRTTLSGGIAQLLTGTRR